MIHTKLQSLSWEMLCDLFPLDLTPWQAEELLIRLEWLAQYQRQKGENPR